ncbi:MAG: right-handed parallel beta-helix repeat-containing protein [Verrucomicrobiota bacterium]
MNGIRFVAELVVVGFASVAAAREFHVAPQGAVNSPGTPDEPLQSLQAAIDLAQAGDTVYLHGGHYRLQQPVQVTRSGSAGRWLTLQAIENEIPVLDAGALTNDAVPGFTELGAFNIKGARYVRVSGVTVSNSHNGGFMLHGPGTDHIDLLGCRSHRSYNSGIGVWYADHVNVWNCEVTGANDQEMRTPRQRLEHEAPHEAISLAGARFFDVASNDVHHCVKEGIDCKEVSAHGRVHHNSVHDMPRQGLYADAWFGLLEDVEFDSNIVTRCEWGGAISVEGAGARMENVRFHHNTIFNNRASGILFGVWGTNGPRHNIAVFNNTLVGNGSKGHWAGSTGAIDIRSTNLFHVRIFNNICSRNYAFAIATFAPPGVADAELKALDVVIENNWLEAGPAVDEGGGVFNRTWPCDGRRHFSGDPGFVDPAHGNFRLRENSPARGKGVVLPGIGGGKDPGA